MPNFKPKAKKKIIPPKKGNITLDNKHNEIMKNMEYEKDNKLPKLRKEIEMIKNKLKKNIKLEEELDLKDRLKEIKKEIRKIKKKKKEYLLDNSEYIFEYFEKKKDLAKGKNKTKILHSFFSKEKKKKEKENESNKCVQNYLENVDESFLNINDYRIEHDKCKCGGELIPELHEGVIVCSLCSSQRPYLVEHEKPSYKEPPKEVCFYAYKRINHFREILAQFQAKETTQIPPEVIKNIKNQVKKERIELKSITNQKAKDILKKLGYNKYYEHIPFIKDKLGIKPPVMKPELEDKLCSLFMDIQKPYAKHCPDNRVNFLNYYYVLYKICELLGEVQFLPFFPLLKDPVKRIEQDEIWKKICGELNWEFIETI
tara:strand:- start:2216 stop:3328 length:1113 start_codon:yes stop_codon:yes gene_type:complete